MNLLMDISFCRKTATIWQTVGYVLMVLKILVPVILIIWGTIGLAQAMISGEDKAVSKQAGSLIKKLVIGIVIFFIPTIVNALFSLMGTFLPFKSDYNNCLNCITSPRKKCDTSGVGNELFPVSDASNNSPYTLDAKIPDRL